MDLVVLMVSASVLIFGLGFLLGAAFIAWHLDRMRGEDEGLEEEYYG